MILQTLIDNFAGVGAGYHRSLMVERGYSTKLDYPGYHVGPPPWGSREGRI